MFSWFGEFGMSAKLNNQYYHSTKIIGLEKKWTPQSNFFSQKWSAPAKTVMGTLNTHYYLFDKQFINNIIIIIISIAIQVTEN